MQTGRLEASEGHDTATTVLTPTYAEGQRFVRQSVTPFPCCCFFLGGFGWSVSFIPTFRSSPHHFTLFCPVPAGFPSPGGDVTVYVLDINQPSFLKKFFYSVLVSVSVFMALSTVFRSMHSPDNSPLSHSVLLVLLLPYWSFQPYIISVCFTKYEVC